MASVLTYENIYKSYGEQRAVNGVSFDVLPGEVFGLLGPNGAGKSTLIRILMDIIRADEGRVLLFGQPFDLDQLDRVGYLPEERGLYKKNKTLDVMTYFGQLKGLPRAEARRRGLAWLTRMNLSEYANKKIEALSKGMAQKVQIASTLLHEPLLCVLDEPFSGLDPQNARDVQDLIAERRRAGLTTILSAHQMNLVETLCDRVALINRGELVVYGGVQEVRERHSENAVQVTARELPREIEGVEEVVTLGGARWKLRLHQTVSPQHVLASLVGAGVEVEAFEKALTSMEEIFIRVVKGVA